MLKRTSVDLRTFLDELFDALHKMGRCPCSECPIDAYDAGRTGGGQWWLSIRLPGGKRLECRGWTLDEAAEAVLNADPQLGTIAQVR